MNKGDDDCGWPDSANKHRNNESFNSLVVVQKRPRTLGLFTGICFFALMGRYGVVLLSMVLFVNKSSLFRNLV